MIPMTYGGYVEFDLFQFVLDNLDAAGVIGGYVSISIVGVALLTYASKGKFKSEGQIGPRWTQPFLGAVIGIIPGCGGTVVVSSMYKNKRITFGGLLATFIATLGEGSFVLLGASAEADVAANLKAYVIVNVVGFVVGVLLGTFVDALKIEFNATSLVKNKSEKNEAKVQVGALPAFLLDKVGFVVILALGLFLLPGSIMALWGAEIAAIGDLTVMATTTLTLVCIAYYLIEKLMKREHCCADEDNIKSVLSHAVQDIALVVFYVFVGLFIMNYLIDVVIGAERFDAWMTSSAFAVVLIAALIGASPGCGGMIAVAVAYTAIPNFPIAALIAAGIATSGDGIFPLLAQNRKDALIITFIGLGTAIVVGLIALAF